MIVSVPSVAPSEAGVNTTVIVPLVQVIYSEYSEETVPLITSEIAGASTTDTVSVVVTLASAVDVSVTS